MHRQALAVAQAAVAAEVHQPLDVHRDLAAQVALDDVVAIDRLADLQHLGVGELADATFGRDANPVADLLANLGPILWMYCSAISTRFWVGMLTPAIRATWVS